MRIRQISFCAIFTALTAAGAFIKIPIPGNSLMFTLQTFFVFMAGLMLEVKYAFLSQLAYMAIGLIGFPVFSQGGGIAYVLNPSFGFIIGFCACATAVSLLVRKNLISLISDKSKKLSSLFKVITGALISIVILYFFGVTYMYFIYNLYLVKPVQFGDLIVSAAGIFIFLDMIKFALVIPLCIAMYKRLPGKWLVSSPQN